jgi:hypothetical protein
VYLSVFDFLEAVDDGVRRVATSRAVLADPPGIGRPFAAGARHLLKDRRGHDVAVAGDKAVPGVLSNLGDQASIDTDMW